jgi:hypothetical protein
VLLDGYRPWFTRSTHSEPRPATVPWGLGVDGSAGRFPHLRDPAGFAALLHALR